MGATPYEVISTEYRSANPGTAGIMGASEGAAMKIVELEIDILVFEHSSLRHRDQDLDDTSHHADDISTVLVFFFHSLNTEAP